MENALNNQVGMLGNMFLWRVANLKQGVIYFIKQGGGNHKIARVYLFDMTIDRILIFIIMAYSIFPIFCCKLINNGIHNSETS